MAATKYQVMYRLVNDALGTAVTNNANTEYEPTFEFYTDPDHKIFSSNAAIQGEEMEKQQAIITDANNAANPKHDMLFIFNGTKKVFHQRWVDEQVGYVVRNWQAVRSLVGDKDDWSKDFYTLNANTPEEGGMVVTTQKVFQQRYKSFEFTREGKYTNDEMNQIFRDSTIFELNKPKWQDHATITEQETVMYSDKQNMEETKHTYRTGPIFAGIPNEEVKRYDGYLPRVGSVIKHSLVGVIDTSKFYDNVYSKISHTADDVKQVTIPGHYAESTEPPYVIKDQYKRVESSPWVVNCTVGSLEAALIKARILIEAIGIENVKIVKLVAFDQFVKIQ